MTADVVRYDWLGDRDATDRQVERIRELLGRSEFDRDRDVLEERLEGLLSDGLKANDAYHMIGRLGAEIVSRAEKPHRKELSL